MRILKCCVLIVIGTFLLSSVCAQTKINYKKRHLLLRDEGLSQLSYVDLANPKANWFLPIPAGRDLQLVGQGRVLVGTGTGYEEIEIKTGKKVAELTTFPGTVTARRLKTGNTLLVGANWQEKEGIVLVEVDGKGAVQRTIVYPGFSYVRLVRETSSGTFLVTANNKVFEGNEKGEIIWQADLTGPEKIHAWQALRLKDGTVAVSCGFVANMQIIGKDGKLISTITGPTEVNPYFFAGFQVISNENFVISNWQGHGPGHGGSGAQVLEYTPKGELAWSYRLDPTKYSSLQGVLVLDGLDEKRLHVENEKGILAPVK